MHYDEIKQCIDINTSIFILVRIEDEAAADYLDEWHYRDYTALGYRAARVPVLPPQERLAFVLEKLSEQELR